MTEIPGALRYIGSFWATGGDRCHTALITVRRTHASPLIVDDHANVFTRAGGAVADGFARKIVAELVCGYSALPQEACPLLLRMAPKRPTRRRSSGAAWLSPRRACSIRSSASISSSSGLLPLHSSISSSSSASAGRLEDDARLQLPDVRGGAERGGARHRYYVCACFLSTLSNPLRHCTEHCKSRDAMLLFSADNALTETIAPFHRFPGMSGSHDPCPEAHTQIVHSGKPRNSAMVLNNHLMANNKSIASGFAIVAQCAMLCHCAPRLFFRTSRRDVLFSLRGLCASWPRGVLR